MTETLTRRLARFAATLTYEELPPRVVALAKALTLDTLGTALAATTLGEGCRESIEVMSALGGRPESSIIGTSAKVCAPNAAFANGALAHALNYDAIGTDTGHTGVVSFTAPLAIAEARGPVSGRRFIAAVAVAAEVTARVSRAVVHEGARTVNERLLSGQYFGYFAAAAGAGRLLGLTPELMHSAFGIALMQVSGSRQIIVGGDAPAKAIYGAFPNHGGVLAALLAEAGLGAEIDALDGSAGFYGMAADGRFEPDAIVSELGTRFDSLHAQFKPWATSGVVTPFIEAAIELAVQHDLHVAGIASVEIVGPLHIRQWCEPLAERRHPANGAAAANSTIYGTAKALAHRDVVLADFAPAGMRDPLAAELADRTTYRLDDAVAGGVVIVHTADGRRLEARVDNALGHPDRPMSDERLQAKFRDCCSYSALAPAGVEKLIAFIAELESADDVSPLAASVGEASLSRR